jgi:NAD(P)-dependent dehydrogenase (short-subunit alcohol dehydrogenase family)
MARLAPGPEAIAKVAASVPLGRLGSPDDVGLACMFLGSPMGAYVSGVVLPVDGGWAQTACGGMGMFLGRMVDKIEGR